MKAAVFATHDAATILAAQYDFRRRLVRALRRRAAATGSSVIDAFDAQAAAGACARHAAKAHGLRARDLWAIEPAGFWRRILTAAGVSTWPELDLKA